LRQNLYTCCRCGREERTTIECDDAPPGWALVSYQRITPSEEKQQAQIALTTHACEDCAIEVLTFLKKATGEDIDQAFDDGGAA
jgi:hypothetical protein